MSHYGNEFIALAHHCLCPLLGPNGESVAMDYVVREVDQLRERKGPCGQSTESIATLPPFGPNKGHKQWWARAMNSSLYIRALIFLKQLKVSL
jgi:hypothetical protein